MKNKYDDTKHEKKLTKIFEKQLENKKYNDKITPLQQKFIDNTVQNMANGQQRNVQLMPAMILSQLTQGHQNYWIGKNILT